MEETPFGYTLSVRLTRGEKCFGPGIAELLERIDKEHSLRRATAQMGMAYSKAWRILREAENSLGFALLESTAGGSGGGGAVLTDAARKLLADYRAFEKELNREADALCAKYFGDM